MRHERVSADADIEQIKCFCADEINSFGKQFQYIRRNMYGVLGLYYPEECTTNYRDSWFHYRKLYMKKDSTEILNEKYGLEEHLLRAAKDAMICFLQQLGYWLEVWYRNKEYMVCDISCSDIYEKMYLNLSKNWVKSIEGMSNGDMKLFSNACLYRYMTYIESDSVRSKLQILIHSIKNLILDLRLGGVDISRPTDNVIYLERSIKVLNEMCDSLEETGILYLISSTGVILNECGINESMNE